MITAAPSLQKKPSPGPVLVSGVTGRFRPEKAAIPSLKVLLAWAALLFGLGGALPGAAGAGPEPNLVTHGPRDRPRVALTFDLCQIPGRPAGFDEAIVRILETLHVPATFFAGGDWMRTHPAEIRRLAANPLFEIGNHSWSHPDLRRLSRERIVQEVHLATAELERLTGRTTTLFRLPYGYESKPALQILDELGLKVIQWDVVTGDPDPRVSAEEMISTVKRRTRNGSIIIMHANGRGRHTAEALPGMIAELRKKGFELTTVSDLLGDPAGGQSRI